MNNCEYCTKRKTCNKDFGVMFGFCNSDFELDTEEIYSRLDNLEGCEDNEVYAVEIKRLRLLLGMEKASGGTPA